MDLDDLIRSSIPDVGPRPTIGDLRLRARRRRNRRLATAGVAVVVAVVAVAVPLLVPGDERNSTVSVRPNPVDRTLSTWSKVATIADPGTVTNPVNVELVVSDDDVFVVASTDNLADPSQNMVKVSRLDRTTGKVTDLGYEAVRPVGTRLASVVAWDGGPTLVVGDGADWWIDHWADGAWTTLEPPDVPADALREPWLSTLGPDLVASLPLGSATVVTGEAIWSTADGRSWEGLPEPPDRSGYGLYSGGDTLVRQGFSPAPASASLTSILRPADATWTEVPPPAFDSYGSLRSVELGGVLVTCGSQSSEAHYDCSRWTSGDDTQRRVDPPPFLQGEWQEQLGERIGLISVPDRGVVVTDGREWALYDQRDDRWRRLPRPSSVGGTQRPVVIDGDVYAVMADLQEDAEAPITYGVYRLEVGADDPEVPRATEVGDGYRVRLPSDRWTATVSATGDGISVGTGETVPDGAGGECPALQVDFVDATRPDAPSPFARLTLPDSTRPCEPAGFTTMAGGRRMEMLVHRSGPTDPADLDDLRDIIGSFRASSR